ncbi:hypothetical protein JNB_06134 [Janibacter sp. HTCC2649]|uniref:hypothetical protein n=1 Tax=Janibacter sp. HTCC2649 TaxID=313589 RepID=UPI0000670D40|nr:hypothetical protein [Janibacter sp. HTCC2649]EAP99724.1 hypothetical protein JNB_06134 [Janibacter sp. HTCC2649]
MPRQKQQALERSESADGGTSFRQQSLETSGLEAVGTAGIGVDSEGGLIGYLAVCDQRIDGATLYYDDGSAKTPEAREVKVGEWASASLKPGEVYFFDHPDVDRNQDVYVTGSPDEFRKAACRP